MAGKQAVAFHLSNDLVSRPTTELPGSFVICYLVSTSKPLFHLSFLYWQAIALEDWVDEQVRERMQSTIQTLKDYFGGYELEAAASENMI
jgi:hypothetical protein